MTFGKDLKSFLARGRHECPGCAQRLQLTGETPANPVERILEELIGAERSAPVHWLEQRLSERFYQAELGQGSGAVDIGVWGPSLFHTEASRALSEVRPDFGYFI